jgi:hypothetical protein
VLTGDFELSYDLLSILRRRGLSFKLLDGRSPVPGDVAVVLTGPGESSLVEGVRTVEVGQDRDAAVAEAVRLLTGKESYRILIIGIDPGEKRIGFAVLGDGEVLEAHQLRTVGEVEEALDHARDRYPSTDTIVRVGHGAPTVRNRIVNAALGRDMRTEIADETSTTRRVDRPDVEAAIAIAAIPGAEVVAALAVFPSDGELNHIKKRSRELSGGELTISTELSRRVALGDLTLEEAVSIARERGQRIDDG